MNNSGRYTLFLLTAILSAVPACRGPRQNVSRYAPVRVTRPPDPLMQTPRDIRAEYTLPTGTVMQSFFWDQYGGRWQIRPLTTMDYAAGYCFRHPFDLTDNPTARALNFRLKPATMIPHISLALTDHAAPDEQQCRALPIENYSMGTWQDWTRFTIPLDRFISRPDTSSMTWQAVKGIRIHVAQDRPSNAPVEIRDLRFGPVFWGVPKNVLKPAR